jgi:hypothetical protein
MEKYYLIESREGELVISAEGNPVLRCLVTDAALYSVLEFIRLLEAAARDAPARKQK